MALAWLDNKVTPFLTQLPYIGANMPARTSLLWGIKMLWILIKLTPTRLLIIIIFCRQNSRPRVLLRVIDLTKTSRKNHRSITYSSDPPVLTLRFLLFQKEIVKGTNCGMRSKRVRMEPKHHRQAPVWIQKWFESVNQLVLKPLWLRYLTTRIPKWMTLRRRIVRND